MRSSRQHDMLEPLLETRVIILEISSRFAPEAVLTADAGALSSGRMISRNDSVIFNARERGEHIDAG
ncbi:hypothetical protein B5V03_25915 [Bradyrhizobium betae]|uniref:Uncharacterized protein n=1 Tax=Bradyrhizobium betae TaxID=244734 RepID=A0A4Q1UTC9_9BRAD|nr:hypothetical protein B5V03_25915 [Bradyrhizobium betae]